MRHSYKDYAFFIRYAVAAERMNGQLKANYWLARALEIGV